MKLKHLLFCSAAGILVGGTAAQAGDIPVKRAAGAKGVEYVETCPQFGRAFIKMPGTDICMAMRGGLEFKFSYLSARDAVKENGKEYDPYHTVSNTNGWMMKLKPGWDFRTSTEYGTLRTFFAFKSEMDNGVHEDRVPTLSGKFDAKIDKAYIEWAGFTVGLTNSQFEYWAHDDTVLSIGYDAKASNMQFTYTWKLGKGVKATLGIEDTGDDLEADIKDLDKRVEKMNKNVDEGTEIVDGLTIGEGKRVEPGLGPQRWNYAVVASLVTEQDWGDAKLAGILNPLATFGSVSKVDSSGNAIADHKEVKWGWAVLGGITFNLPMLGKKDQLMLEAQYCDGAVSSLCIEKAATRMDDKGILIGGLQRKDYDAFILPNSDGKGWSTHTTKVTTFAYQLRHYWAPLWRTNVSGSFGWIKTPDVAKDFALDKGGLGDAHGWDASVNLIWGESRKTAEIGAEVMYKSLHQDLPGDGKIKLGDSFEKDPHGWAVSSWIKRSW